MFACVNHTGIALSHLAGGKAALRRDVGHPLRSRLGPFVLTRDRAEATSGQAGAAPPDLAAWAIGKERRAAVREPQPRVVGV